jgi:hypothetical protein
LVCGGRKKEAKEGKRGQKNVSYIVPNISIIE